MKNWLLALLLISGTALADDALYHREHRATLPGSGHNWGFVALDPTRPYLFLARRENGLSVFDTRQQRLVKTVEQSEGANGVVFVPEVDRVFVLHTDGSLSVVQLSTLTPLKRIPVAQSNLNSAVYEPTTGKVIIVSGRRADRSTLFEFDPKQERITGAHEMAVKKSTRCWSRVTAVSSCRCGMKARWPASMRKLLRCSTPGSLPIAPSPVPWPRMWSVSACSSPAVGTRRS